MSTVIAYRIAGGPYADTATTFDVAVAAPSSTTYWDGTAYSSILSYLRIKPGTLVGIVSIASAVGLRPESGLNLSLLRIATVQSVVPCPAALSWWTPDTNDYEGLPNPISPNFAAGAREGVANQHSRVTLTRPLGRTLTGAGASGQPTYDYMVLLQQTGPTATEAGLRFFGQTTLTAALAIGDKTLPIVGSFAQFIPVGAGGDYPTVAPSILGAEPAPFLATGGRVSIFRGDEAVVVHHTATVGPQTVTNGQDVNLGRTRLASARVYGNDGAEITTGFTRNLTTGHVVFSAVAGYSQPVTIKHRIEDMLLVSQALEQSLKTARGVTHVFPSGSKVSSVLMFGDLQARVHDGFQQTTWASIWADTRSGDAPLAAYNEAAHPITVTNAGAISERWAVIFTSATGFKVVGEQVGEVVAAGAGSTATNTAPLNPATGAPYFTIPSTGWGTGWSAGNVYRFNTDGPNAPIWLIRSIAPSDPFVGQDKFSVALRGNVNA